MREYNESAKEIEEALEEQKRIVDLVQSTKMYRVLEGVHGIRGKNSAYVNKGEQIMASLKHICGKNDIRIEQIDALNIVKEQGKIIETNTRRIKESCDKIEEKYNQAEKDYVEVQSALEQNFSLLYKLNDIDTSICILAPLESIDLPDGYSRRIKNIDTLFEKKQIKVYMSKDYGLNEILPLVREYSEEYYSIKYNPKKVEHCVWVTMIAQLIGKVYIHSVYQSLESIATNSKIIKFYDFHGVVPEELKFMEREEESIQMNSEEKIIVLHANYILQL